jgi:hypothetical protein
MKKQDTRNRFEDKEDFEREEFVKEQHAQILLTTKSTIKKHNQITKEKVKSKIKYKTI